MILPKQIHDKIRFQNIGIKFKDRPFSQIDRFEGTLPDIHQLYPIAPLQDTISNDFKRMLLILAGFGIT